MCPFLANLLRCVIAICRSHSHSLTAISGSRPLTALCRPRPLIALCRPRLHRRMLIATIYFMHATWNVASLDCGVEWIFPSKSIITLHQGSTYHRFAFLALFVEGPAFKATIVASKSEIRGLCLFSDSQSLITLSGAESFLFGMCCLLQSFSFSICFLYVSCSAIVLRLLFV